MTSIAILDYGMGNLRSVEKALERVGADVIRTPDADVAGGADGLVLPGVGAFPKGMERIRALGLDELVADRVAAGTPLLGICLGMQLLFSSSPELGGAGGLGLLGGGVEALGARGLKSPHIGGEPVPPEASPGLTAGLEPSPPFYFAPSFAARPAEPA